MGNGENISAGAEAASQEVNATAPGDAWLERRLRVFERALKALEERQEKSEQTYSLELRKLEERIAASEAGLERVELEFGESHNALEKTIEEATRHQHALESAIEETKLRQADEPDLLDQLQQESVPAQAFQEGEHQEIPEEEIASADVMAAVTPQNAGLEFLAVARRHAIEAASKAESGKRKPLSRTKPLLIGIATLALTVAGAGMALRHAPGSSAAAAVTMGSGSVPRRVAVDPDRRLQVLSDAGNRKAMHALAMQFADNKDMVGAARWFERAAALGYGDLQFNLAVLYERGEGVKQSLVEAFVWYSIAAQNDDLEAAERVEALQTQLTPAQIIVAERAIRLFKPEPADDTAETTALKTRS